MITEVMKLLPILTVVGGGAASKDKIKEQIQKVMNITQIVAVQSEVNDLAKIVYLDIISDGRNAVDPGHFADYCRKNLLVKAGVTRDTSKDFWGTEYRLSFEGNKFLVTSAGPDTQFETPDDIVSGLSLE